MADEKTKLAVIDGETLMDMKLPPTKFCVDTLLPQGLCILGGASKIGKSWWVLDLCVRIAKGEPMWDLKTTAGTTLYLCLEDTLRRVQNRLLCITDEVPPNAFFATSAGTLSDCLCEQIRNFVKEHPDTVFVAVDTFQIVRNNSIDTSYANDYEEIRILKQLADELSICLLLVHHLRKQGDSDPFNKLTGTTGIVGAVDTAFVLDNGGGAERPLHQYTEYRGGVYGKDGAGSGDGEPQNDGADAEPRRTGWEESRAVYFELLRNSFQEYRDAGQHDRETAPKNIENYDSHGGIGSGAVAAGLRGILEAGSIIDGTAENPEERRKRIEAQENASNLGAVIGLAVGILSAAADSEEDVTAEENNGPTITM